MSTLWSEKRTYLLVGIMGMGLLMVSLFFALQKPLSIEVDGKTIETSVFFSSKVGDVLEINQITIGEKDKVLPSLDTAVEKGTKIVVTRAFKVKVMADGECREVLTTPVAVKEAIKMAGISLGEKDIVKTTPGEKTVANQEIEILRVKEEEIQEEASIPYGIETTDDNSLERGLSRTVKSGKNGLMLNTIKIVYHNGQEVKREVVNSERLSEPQNKVIAMGTISSVSRGGENLDFREARYMQASAYTYTGYRTATGMQPAVGLVAVDPAVIPLGTRLYIEGYGYAQAADTGGAIKGNKLDLFMEDRSQCIKWGRRMTKVYILD